MIKNKKIDTIQRICIVKLSAMGDIIHAMIALQFIKKHYPTVIIDWVVEEGFKGVLENNPDINNILPINLKSVKKDKLAVFSQIKLVKEYAKNNYDVIIDAQGLIKSALVAKFLKSKSIKSTVIGFDKHSTREGLASLLYDKKVSIGYEKNVIDRNIAVLCNSLDINVSKDEILNKEQFLYSTSNNDEIKDKIIFVVGASKENKIYPKEKFLDLAHELSENIVVVWGNEEELSVAQWLTNETNFIKTAPKGNLNDLKHLISNAKLVIGGDTGPTHMAWALNVPSVTIFGNTPEYRNTYVTPINKVIKSNSKVDPFKLDKNDFSINEIKPREILNIVEELI